MSVVDSVEQYPVQSDLAEPPTEEDILEALGRTKCGKAGGKSGVVFSRTW